MKKILAILLMLALSILSACGQETTTDALADTPPENAAPESISSSAPSTATEPSIKSADEPSESSTMESEIAQNHSQMQSEAEPDAEVPALASQASDVPTLQPESLAPTESLSAEDIVVGEDGMIAVNITVDGQDFAAAFYDNPSARVILNQMPITITMDDYAGQEKVIGLPYDFPNADTEQPDTIQSGELYLWSGNQLVLFYTTFQNSYGGYVRIGKIGNPAGLASVLGSGSVDVTFAVPQ